MAPRMGEHVFASALPSPLCRCLRWVVLLLVFLVIPAR
jgi:hypothetical protein